jgi:hypothetical protein
MKTPVPKDTIEILTNNKYYNGWIYINLQHKKDKVCPLEPNKERTSLSGEGDED